MYLNKKKIFYVDLYFCILCIDIPSEGLDDIYYLLN